MQEQQKAKEVKTSDKAAKQVAREVKEVFFLFPFRLMLLTMHGILGFVLTIWQMEELEMQQELQRVETTQIHAVEEKNLEALHKFQREQKIRELKVSCCVQELFVSFCCVFVVAMYVFLAHVGGQLLREHLRKRNEAQMQNLLEVQSLQRDIPIFEQQARKKHQVNLLVFLHFHILRSIVSAVLISCCRWRSSSCSRRRDWRS